MGNSGLPKYGIMEFVSDGSGDVEVVLTGDFTPLIGQEVEARPIKVQAKTVLAEISKIDASDGAILDRDTLTYGNPSTVDMIASLQEMGGAEQAAVLGAISGINERRYDDVVAFVAAKTAGKVDFKVLKQK